MISLSAPLIAGSRGSAANRSNPRARSSNASSSSLVQLQSMSMKTLFGAAARSICSSRAVMASRPRPFAERRGLRVDADDHDVARALAREHFRARVGDHVLHTRAVATGEIGDAENRERDRGPNALRSLDR